MTLSILPILKPFRPTMPATSSRRVRLAISFEKRGVVGRPHAFLTCLLVSIDQGLRAKTLRCLNRPEPSALRCLYHPAPFYFLDRIYYRHRGYQTLAIAFPQSPDSFFEE